MKIKRKQNKKKYCMHWPHQYSNFEQILRLTVTKLEQFWYVVGWQMQQIKAYSISFMLKLSEYPVSGAFRDHTEHLLKNELVDTDKLIQGTSIHEQS